MRRLELLKQSISSFQYNKLQIKKDGEVGTIWMNSPKDLNSLGQKMFLQLENAVRDLNYDKNIKVLVIRSKVNKIFCAGANIKEIKENDMSQYPNSLIFRKAAINFKQYHKPVISIVQGKALGGGFELALLSNIILCSEKAQFGLPEITLGIIPGIGGTQNLTRIVGQKVAQRMILTGLPIDAKEAHRLNIAHLIPTENFEEKVKEIINSIASKSYSSLIAASKSIKFAAETTLEQGLEHEGSIFQLLYTTKGAKQGLNAFVDKRKPNFKGI